MFFGCHCCGCPIFTDDFNDGVLSGFTQTAGTWTEVEQVAGVGGYVTTSSDNAKLTCDTAHPDSIPSHYVRVFCYGADDGDEPRVYLGSGHYVQLTIGDPNGCLGLYTAAGALLTKMRVEAAADTSHELKVWYGDTPVADGGDSQLAAQLNSGTILRYNVTRAGNTVALGTGNVTSEVRFDDFHFGRHWTSDADDSSCPKPDAPDCTIITDSFNRANSTNIGCLLTEDAGALAIDTNALVATSNNSKAIVECLHPQNSSAISPSVSVKGATANDVIKVWAHEAGGNYGQLIVGTSKTLKVFVGNVEQVSVPISTTVGAFNTMTVTQSDDVLSADVGGVCVTAECANPAGPVKAAIGTGSITSAVTFENFTLSRAKDANNADCVEPCAALCESRCTLQTTRRRILLTVAGFAASSGPDGDVCCEDFNGQFILIQREHSISTPFGPGCWWQYVFPSNLCPGLLFGSGAFANARSLNLVAFPGTSLDWFLWWHSEEEGQGAGNNVYQFTTPYTVAHLDCSVTFTMDFGGNQSNQFCNVPSLSVGAITIDVEPLAA